MKKTFLLMAAWFSLAASPGWSQPFDVDINPDTMRPVVHADWILIGCTYYIRVKVIPQSPPPGTVYLTVSKPVYQTVYYDANAPRNTLINIPVSVNGNTTYTITGRDHNGLYYYYPNSTTVTINPPCLVNSFNPGLLLSSPTTLRITATPDDLSEAEAHPGMLVRWKLEELNPQTWEPVFTIDNPLAWEAFSGPAKANPFNGFNAYEENTVTELQAGSTSEEPGLFDPEKVYRITRSYKMPEEESWMEYAEIIGSVDEEPDRGAGQPLQAPHRELFTLGMYGEHQSVVFHTTVDAGMLSVYDLAGNEITVFELEDETYLYGIDMSGYSKGVYVAKLVSGSQLLTKKFIIH
jgi:hypothetical protein